MEFTGERLVLGETSKELELEHLDRYQFAHQFAEGRIVLDAACGTGYGSAILANVAKRVVGVDISTEAIEHAVGKYGDEHIEFCQASVTELPFQNDEFDMVVSFETLEHIDENAQNMFLREICRVLKPEGMLVMSTPNHEVYSSRGENEFHVKELSYAEFRCLLEAKFKYVKLFSQKWEVCDAIVSDSGEIAECINGLSTERAEYMVAVCSNQPIEHARPHLSIRKDERLKNLMSWAIDNHERNERNNAHIQKLDAQIAEYEVRMRTQELTIAEQMDVLKRNCQTQLEAQEKICAEQLAVQEQICTERLAAQERSYEERLAAQEQAYAEQLNSQKQEHQRALDGNEQALADLQQALRNKEGHIALLLESDRELERIKNSRSWRFMGYIWKVRDAVIPQGSKRRLMGKMCVKFVKHPIHFLKKCSPSRIRKFFKTLKREGVKGTSRRLDEALVGFEITAAPVVVENVPVTAKTAAAKTTANYTPLYVPQWSEPAVSIVIPVYNQFDYTYLCIKSILDHSGDVSYEILIADDCSTDLTTQIDDIIHGLHTVHNEKNLRFLLNCNNAAQYTKGQYILFLNNDTQVQENWLAPLVELIERDETIGMVGSKLIYPDGRLQEAGGILWKDGSAWNFGHCSDPDLPEFNYVKEVDYVSGAAIMIRKSLWEQIGGFDETFVPAYYEDTDLAFEVRKHGYKVMLQPLSRVVHFEGASNGTDTSSGQKAYQVTNQKKFFEKWKDVLALEHFENAQNVFQARDRSRNKETVLVIDHYIPTYDKDAGSRSVDHYLRLLVDLGYNVMFLPDNFYHDVQYAERYEQMGIEILYGVYYRDHWKEFLAEHAHQLDYVLLSRPHISIKYIDFFKEKTQAKIVYYVQDLHFLREEREYEITHDPELLKSSRKFKEQEFYIMERSDVVFTLSQVEKEIIDRDIAPDRAVITPISYFDSFPEEPVALQGKRDIIFVGGFGHHPNEDGVLWFVNNVWETVHKTAPEYRLVIIGSKPTDKILALQNENVIVTGYVTDEQLEQHYADARVCVIPLRYGAGVKGKTIEAMYHRVPIVSTSVGIEGLAGITDYIAPADSEEEFADKVILFCQNQIQAEREAVLYSEYLQDHLSYESAKAIFARVFRKED